MEYNNDRMVKVNATTGAFIGAAGGIIAPVANGWSTAPITVSPGTKDGTFTSVSSVAVDSVNERMYIADNMNHRVVKINTSTGAFIGAIGKTTASTGTCPASGAAPGWCTGGTFGSGAGDGMFNAPSHLSVDVTNQLLYLADYNNNRVVKSNASTGAFIGAIGKTTASTGTCPASGAAPGWCTGGTFAVGTADGIFNIPNAVTIDTIEQRLYIADRNNNRVVKINASTGAFIGAIGNTIASTGTCPPLGAAKRGWCTGGTFASGTGRGMFSMPYGVTFDASRRLLYIGDSYRVVKVRP